MTDTKNDEMNNSIDSDSSNNKHSSMDLTPSSSRNDLDSLIKNSNTPYYSLMQTDSSNNQTNSFYSTSTPISSKKAVENDQLNDSHNISINNTSSGGNNSPLNEKVASLASSVYTELEKIVKLHGRDTVKDLMSILVNILEALDVAYQEKEEQIVENELLKDDYEKLLNQYEREKQSRKDTELKFFQSEDSFAEQKKEYEEKVKSLESIVRMIDLKSKNTSDHVIRLEEKENELKREYNKLHERYTELFKTHCDYMERTKILFGNENRIDTNMMGSNAGGSRMRIGHNQQQQQLNKSENSSNKLIDLLRSPSVNINRNDLINTLKITNRSELSMAINNLLSQELNQSNESVSSSTIAASSTSSLASLSSQQNKQQSQDTNNNSGDLTNISEKCINEDDDENGNEETSRSKLNIQSSENFDEHLSSNCVEFDDTASVDNNINNKEKDYEEEEEISTKNDLSLFNELSRENYDITELDDGADLTGMTREVANLIRENSELLQTKHALNVLKDDLIVRLDQFSSEMVILREEIKSLQTVKACLQLRISELEEEAKKTKEDLAQKTKKQEEDDENVPMSQRKRFTRAEMARVLMERNQYKERLIDLQEAVRWTEMMRASKFDSTAVSNSQTMPANPTSMTGIVSMQSQTLSGHNSGHSSGIVADSSSEQHQEQHKKKSPLWKFFSDLFGSSSNSTINTTANVNQQLQGSVNTLPNSSNNGNKVTASSSTNVLLSPTTKKANKTQSNDQAVPHNEINQDQMNISDKAAKAYEFLKEDSQKLSSQMKTSGATGENKIAKEDGRMQAYGWSLPSKATLDSTKSNPTSNSTITVPVPVYCRPLFEQDNNLKLSCSSTVNFLFDSKVVKNCGEIIESSSFGHFKSANNNEYKSSCIWICNLNENDTHVSILDANRPGDLIEQFVLKYLKIYCVQSISGANQNEYPLSEDKLKNLSKNLRETNSSLFLAKKSEDSTFNQENTENINYIEYEYDQQEQNLNKQSEKNDEFENNPKEAFIENKTVNNLNKDANNNNLDIIKTNDLITEKKEFRIKEESAKTKKKKLKYSLSSYMISLIKFYNCFIRLQRYILLNVLFFYTLFELIKIPFYFLFSFIISNLYYDKSICDSATSSLSEFKACKPKENKIKKSIIDRTLLNNLIRKSLDKRFVNKYLSKYLNDNLDCKTDFYNDMTVKKAVKDTKLNQFKEHHDNVILINEVKSNAQNICFDSIKVEKAFLSLKNCKEITLNDETDEVKNQQEKILSSLYPTMWMGSHEGWILVHSSISNVSKTIDKVKLKDAILCIIQNGGRVIVGLADGSVAIFHRNTDGLWDLKNFYVINFDRPHHSIRCLINVYDTVWCGCRNKIFIINPDEFKLVSTIEVHPRKENQVRHMVWSEDGVWVSLRLDSTLRLYHAKTHQHLQYLDIEPFITRMLGTSNLGLSLIRISSLLIGSKRLWIGTGNGVILSLPFSDFPKEANTPYSSKISSSNSSNSLNIPGSVVRVNNDQNNSKIPFCNLSESQFSFHGHRNAIKFFLSVPSEAFQKLNTKSNSNCDKPKSKEDSYEKVETNLILSGGHGYIDFRIGDSANKTKQSSEQKCDGKMIENNKSERSHLIVWQLNSN